MPTCRLFLPSQKHSTSSISLHNCGAVFQRVLWFRSYSYLGSENGRLNELERAAVDLDQTLSGLGVGDSLSISNNSQHFC